MRERWFGATGRRVPEIALRGEVELDDALVLETLDDAALRDAHAHGRPVAMVVRTPEELKAALARPEVSTAVVDDPALLDVDLTELTYG